MFMMISAAAAIIPMSIYLFIIWWLDRYEREPFKYVFYCFIYGAIGAIIIAYLISAVLSLGTPFLTRFINDPLLAGALIIAPLAEETTKALFLFTTFIKKRIDNLTDGLVYGGAIGLGFGMTENFLYFIFYGTTIESWIYLVIIRTIFSAVMHCISTATFGAFFALSHFSSSIIKFAFPLIGITTSICIHFMWNLTVSNNGTYFYGFLFIVVIVSVFAFLFFMSLRNEKRIIIKELSEEAELNLIPFEHLEIFRSLRNNNQIDLFDKKLRKRYINALTLLAFRKMQHRYSSGVYKNFYAGEIENYRTYIQSLLREPY